MIVNKFPMAEKEIICPIEIISAGSPYGETVSGYDYYTNAYLKKAGDHYQLAIEFWYNQAGFANKSWSMPVGRANDFSKAFREIKIKCIYACKISKTYSATLTAGKNYEFMSCRNDSYGSSYNTQVGIYDVVSGVYAKNIIAAGNWLFSTLYFDLILI